ncbi:MAG: hypothetical protein FWG98_05010 [Candidatus Cloacimonetes bacterium]|nr:hypothetical protein [Candidatus Cloacimonadota bacterium]
MRTKESFRFLVLLITVFCIIIIPNFKVYAITLCESGESCCKDTESTQAVEIVFDCHGNQIVVEQTGCKCTGEEICRCEDNQSEDGTCNCPDPFEEIPNDYAIVTNNPNTNDPRFNSESFYRISIFYPNISEKEYLDYLNDNQSIPNDISIFALWLLHLY